MTCSIDGCARRAQARGWCHKHYMHWHTYGDPRRRPTPTLAARILARVVVSATTFEGTPCWEWQGKRLPSGYGRLSVGNVGTYTHRAAWEAFRGPIPAGHHIDHRCENKPCCNPAHLEPVTPATNTRRHFAKHTRKGRAA